MTTIHIVCASDENMVMPAAAMLKSLFVNASPDRRINVSFLDGGISNASKLKLLDSLKPNNESVHFLNVNPLCLRDMKITGHITIVAYYRLLIPSMLPIDITKVIYLDVDLIVDHDIGELWDTDMHGQHLLAVPEQGKDCMHMPFPYGLANYKKMLGLEPHKAVFNSGVLVIDLDKWRRDHIAPKLVSYLQQHKEHVRFWDQDALNVILAHQWGELDYRWNVLTQLFDCYPWNAGVVKDRAVYQRLIRHPFIVHFNTANKPWHRTSKHPKADLFFHYLDLTQWQGWRPEHFYVYQCSAVLKRMLLHISRPGMLQRFRICLQHYLRHNPQ